MGTTVTAALIIVGSTCHYIFYLPVNRPLNIISGAALRKLQQRLQDMKIVIFDKVSMMGKKMIYFIDQCLYQSFGKMYKPFGCFCLILVGDFQQLPPVGNKPLYEVGSYAYLLFDEIDNVVQLVE